MELTLREMCEKRVTQKKDVRNKIVLIQKTKLESMKGKKTGDKAREGKRAKGKGEEELSLENGFD